jgi:hypothetical protein
MIIEGEMDAMSAENALFSEITPQMQVNRNSRLTIYIIFSSASEFALLSAFMFSVSGWDSARRMQPVPL